MLKTNYITARGVARAVSHGAGVDRDVSAGRNRAYTRRQMIGGMAMGLGSMGISIMPLHAWSGACTSVHQELEFEASSARVYEALLDEKQFSAFSGAAAQIQREAGGAFELFGGRVMGRNVELLPNQRIVQVWRLKTWPSGVYSIVWFELLAHGSGTLIDFDQAGFPPGDWEALDGRTFPAVPPPSEWSRRYWDPLRRYLDLEGK